MQPTINIEQIFVMQVIATILFVLAVLHTFSAKKIVSFAHRYPEGTGLNSLFHFLGEVEIVFGLWAFLFLLVVSFAMGTHQSVMYLERVNFAEPVFVFCIMCVASTQPILNAARAGIRAIAIALSRIIKLDDRLSEFFCILTIGPVLGSFITEPAAMTVSAILVKEFIDSKGVSLHFKYLALGLLFVNVSIGGVFTNYAAPPVLMVAGKFGWDSLFMLSHFGWRAAVSILIGTFLLSLTFRKDILLKARHQQTKDHRSPFWLVAVHLFFMTLIVCYHNHVPFFLALFLLFIGVCEVTKAHQTPLRIKESLLVGFFLCGLVTLGSMQAWWLEKTISMLGEYPLYFGAAALTSVTDNAALTYLGSLVPTLSAAAKYMLVAGSVVGGGLTVIANAPNPVGYGILRSSFGEDGVSALRLFWGALPFTLIALILFGMP